MDEQTNLKFSAVSKRPLASVLLAVCAMGFCAAVLGWILNTRGRFVQVFADFELLLPAITHLAIGPVLPAVLAVLTVAGIAKEAIRPLGTARDWLNVVILFLAAVCLSGVN